MHNWCLPTVAAIVVVPWLCVTVTEYMLSLFLTLSVSISFFSTWNELAIRTQFAWLSGYIVFLFLFSRGAFNKCVCCVSSHSIIFFSSRKHGHHILEIQKTLMQNENGTPYDALKFQSLFNETLFMGLAMTRLFSMFIYPIFWAPLRLQATSDQLISLALISISCFFFCPGWLYKTHRSRRTHHENHLSKVNHYDFDFRTEHTRAASLNTNRPELTVATKYHVLEAQR